jgi:uncharacterized protein
MRERRQPERTCVGCRATGSKGELIRVVRAADGAVVFDPTGRSPGRGAYVHPSTRCLQQALRRTALARALRTGLSDPEAARLVTELSERLGEQH